MAIGRKKLSDEIQITRRYADLSEKAFKLITKKLDSTDKTEQNFALDWLKGGFARMIPQKLGGDPDNTTPIPIYGNFSIQGHNVDKKHIQPAKKD